MIKESCFITIIHTVDIIINIQLRIFLLFIQIIRSNLVFIIGIDYTKYL
jgi:hypothetical protein